MLLLVKKKSQAKIKGKIEISKTSFRLLVRTVIKRAIILSIISSFLK